MTRTRKPKIRLLKGTELAPGDLVWAYLRHSPGDEQTIGSQRLAVEDYCAARRLVVAHWWIDEAKSGGSVDGRDAFEGMMLASRTSPPPVAGIVVWDLSRFSRDILEPQFYLADLRMRGYKVVSIKDDIPDGEFSTVFESLIVWKNHRYLMDLSANVRRGHDATINSVLEVDGKTITGFSCGGPPPVGYQAVRVVAGTKPSGRPRYLVYWEKTSDPDLRSRVDLAWRMALDDARAGRTVESVRIHKATRIHSSPSTLYHTLRSPTYKGTRHVGERLVDGAHEGYVTPEEWDLVQRWMPKGRLSPIRIHPRRVNSPFYLSGRVYCGYCGSRLDYEPDNRTGRYACLRCAGKKRDAASCHLSKISYDVFMEELAGLLRREVLTEERIRASIQDTNRLMEGSRGEIAEEKRRLEREISVVKRSLDRLLDALEKDGDLVAVHDRLRRRQDEKARLEAELARVALAERDARPMKVSREAIRSVARRMKEALDSGEPDLVRAVLTGLVRRVDVYNDKARVAFTGPSALFSDSTHDLRAINERARGDSNPRSPA